MLGFSMLIRRGQGGGLAKLSNPWQAAVPCNVGFRASLTSRLAFCTCARTHFFKKWLQNALPNSLSPTQGTRADGSLVDPSDTAAPGKAGTSDNPLDSWLNKKDARR